MTNQFAVVAASSLVAAATMTAPAAQASTCQAQNVTSGGSVSADLQAVIDAAGAGDTVEVAGTCGGGFVIDKDLTLGRAPGAVQAVLDGGGVTRVLTVTGDGPSVVAVTLKNLRITGGLSTRGGGGLMMKRAAVRLLSTVVAHNTTKDGGVGGGIYVVDAFRSSLLLGGRTAVRDNRARGRRPGGGIYTDGAVHLHGSTTIAKNSAVVGGGIFAARVVMQDKGRVIANTAGTLGGGIRANEVVLREMAEVNGNTARRGGGVALNGCRNPRNCGLRMTDRSRVASNLAERGGGVYADSSGVFLRDHASIVRNTATKTGGGVFADRGCDNTPLPISVRDDSTISRNAPNDIVNAKSPGCG